MFFRMEHSCIRVTDINRTVEFYAKALGMEVLRSKDSDDMEIVFLGNEHASCQVEVIREKGHPGQFELGENPCHIAFRTDDIDAALKMHREMGCVKRELPDFGVYFIEDPDGYECEVMPVRK